LAVKIWLVLYGNGQETLVVFIVLVLLGLNAYDGNDSGVAGQHYQAPYRALLGGDWRGGSGCGSRGSRWGSSPLFLTSSISARGVAEPAANRL